METIVSLTSRYNVKESIDRLVILLQRSDMIVYARINRQTEAKWYGRVATPMEFILFDDPRLSGPLVERIPLIALCFPMRIIAWDDEQGRCRVAYKDPLAIMKEFNIDRDGQEWAHLRQVISLSLSE